MGEAPRRHPKRVYTKVYRCGKIGYSSFNQALVPLKRIAKKEGDIELDIYKCSRCGMFHLGHPDKSSVVPMDSILAIWNEGRSI